MSKIDQSKLSEEQRKALKAMKEERDERFKKVRRNHRIAIIVLLVIIILLAIRVGTNQPVVLQPDYPMVEDEPNAFPDMDDQDQMSASQGGGAVALVYSDKVTYNLAKNEVTLSYTNPSSSTAAVVLQVIVLGPDNAEYLLAESGALRPGYGVESLDGDLGDITLSTGVYSGVMRVLFYNFETGEKAIVNTDIPVKITVQ